MSAKWANIKKKRRAFGIGETINEKGDFKWHLLWSRVEDWRGQSLGIMLPLQSLFALEVLSGCPSGCV